ncbi:MAG: single-stranded-DNA-specific exonuclease C-terminal domain-containing protein, partial [Clostridiales bacterium]|nr:single-stranded-DNA-specific exonuclease C-terminal domain-containing protein [Clostridiales bacterium]
RLMVSPEFGKSFMLENYNKVVFLDSPPSEAVISYLNRRTKADIYVPKVDNRPSIFSSISSDRQIFGKYFNAIKANGNIKAPNVFSYFKSLINKDKSLNLPQFIACLSVFTELKLLTFVPNTGMKFNSVKSDLDRSSVYKVIEGWQK